MAETSKRNQTQSSEQQSVQQGTQQGAQQRSQQGPSSQLSQQGQAGQSSGQTGGAMQTRGQGQGQRGGGLARHSSFLPSMFSLNPRDLFGMTPFELMRRFTDEMDRTFDDLGLARSGGNGETDKWIPAVDIFERDNNYVVRVEVPGVENEDIQVELTDDGLVIQGERKYEQEHNQKGVYVSERSYGNFYRLIPLPENARPEQAQAQMNNGVLEIVVPKAESQQQRRNIPIQSSGEQGRQSSSGQAQSASGGANRR